VLLGFWTSYTARNPKYWKHNVSDTDLLPSSGEGRETPTLLGPLERTNFKHWTKTKFHVYLGWVSLLGIINTELSTVKLWKELVNCHLHQAQCYQLTQTDVTIRKWACWFWGSDFFLRDMNSHLYTDDGGKTQLTSVKLHGVTMQIAIRTVTLSNLYPKTSTFEFYLCGVHPVA
jgi:hypothetical protein